MEKIKTLHDADVCIYNKELLSTTYSLVALKESKQKLIVGRKHILRERALHSVDVKIYAQVCVYMALAIILHQQSFCNNM